MTIAAAHRYTSGMRTTATLTYFSNDVDMTDVKGNMQRHMGYLPIQFYNKQWHIMLHDKQESFK